MLRSKVRREVEVLVESMNIEIIIKYNLLFFKTTHVLKLMQMSSLKRFKACLEEFKVMFFECDIKIFHKKIPFRLITAAKHVSFGIFLNFRRIFYIAANAS